MAQEYGETENLQAGFVNSKGVFIKVVVFDIGGTLMEYIGKATVHWQGEFKLSDIF